MPFVIRTVAAHQKSRTGRKTFVQVLPSVRSGLIGFPQFQHPVDIVIDLAKAFL